MQDQTSKSTVLGMADPFLTLGVLAHLTGDEAVLTPAWDAALKPGRVPEDLPARLREDAALRLAALLASGVTEPKASPALLARLVDFCAGEVVPEDYREMLLEESGIVRRALDSLPPAVKPGADSPLSVAIIGAGLSGIALAVYLKQAGIDFVIHEKNDGPGGTWYDNRYPGCGVDTASHFYVYSFALNPAWPRHFSKQPDVLAYIERCVDQYGLREHIRFGEEISAARYDEVAHCWRYIVRNGHGETNGQASVLVSAVGQLNVPAYPKISGLDTFAGPVVHTARWDPALEYRNRRVALIGTGASAVQAGPTMAPDVERLLVFQRSPQWLSNRPNYHQPLSEAELWQLANIPFFVNWHRLRVMWQFSDRLYPALLTEAGKDASAANATLRREWSDYIRTKVASRPDLLDKVMPDYPPLTKRAPVDFGWFDMLLRDNVALITDAIHHVDAGAVVTADGARHAVDMIVLGTGFKATRMLHTMDLRGRRGRDLRDLWGEDDPRAYLGMTVPDFPNFFVMYGPNTNLGHGGNLIFQGECQARYIASALRHLIEQGRTELECRLDVFEAYNDEVDRQLSTMVWGDAAVDNWFKNSKGRVVANSPWRVVDYWARTRHFRPADFAFDR